MKVREPSLCIPPRPWNLRICVKMSTPGSNGALKEKYGREIFVSRMLSAIVWSIILQCVYVSHVLFLMNINILHPMEWIKDACDSITNVGTWFYLIPLGVMTFAQGVLMSKDYMTDSTCLRTRFGILCNAFQPRNIVIAILNMVFGAMIVSYYSALLGEEANVFMRKCGSDRGKCLNERNLYLIASGVWVGLYTTLKRQLWEVRVVMFPMIQQLKYSQVKMRLGQLVIQSFKEAILPYMYFCILYWWCGGYLREHLSGFLGLPTSEDYSVSVMFWIKPFLAMRCILFSAIVILTGRTLEMLYQVILTERCHFPITNAADNQLTLIDALASPLPLMKRLGYLDLLLIAERDPVRQSELFSLSLPGGHPHNWNGVVTEVLKALEDLTSGLNVAVCDMNRASNGRVLPSSPPAMKNKIGFGPAVKSPFTPTSPTSSLRIRNMSIHQPTDLSSSSSGTHPFLYAAENIPVIQRKDDDLLSVSKKQVVCMINWIRRKPGISWLFGEMEDAHARHLLLQSQHLSWGAQALAHLAAASMKRDVYGVVQKDLPAIFKTLVQLKTVLERLPLQSHKRALRLGSLDLRMKAALSSSVKRSLYILCNTFGHYLNDLPISDDLRKVLGSYILYKEG